MVTIMKKSFIQVALFFLWELNCFNVFCSSSAKVLIHSLPPNLLMKKMKMKKMKMKKMKKMMTRMMRNLMNERKKMKKDNVLDAQ